MKRVRKIVVVAAVVATLGLPHVGSVLEWGSPQAIPGFGVFPPELADEPPGFNLLYFAAGTQRAATVPAP